MSLLNVSSIETVYLDRVSALRGVSLDIREGSVFAVLGPNGAGKTTLLKTIAGLIKDQPKRGTIHLDGRRIERSPPERVAALGIVYVPEDRGLFRELTVEENLDLGLWGREKRSMPPDLETVFKIFPVLRERVHQQAESLSGGEQQMLAVGRALLRRPRLLMLDEPSHGLAPRVATTVYEALSAISKIGTTILLVEQNARLALSVADAGAVLEGGRVVLQGSASDIEGNENVKEIYLGLGGGEAPLRGWRLHRKRRRW